MIIYSAVQLQRTARTHGVVFNGSRVVNVIYYFVVSESPHDSFKNRIDSDRDKHTKSTVLDETWKFLLLFVRVTLFIQTDKKYCALHVKREWFKMHARRYRQSESVTCDHQEHFVENPFFIFFNQHNRSAY